MDATTLPQQQQDPERSVIAPAPATTGPVALLVPRSPRLVRCLHAEYQTLKARSLDANDPGAVWAGRAAYFVLCMVPLVAHMEAVGDPIDPSFPRSLARIEEAVSFVVLRDGGLGKRVTRMTSAFLLHTPGYVLPSQRDGRPIAAEADWFHLRVVLQCECLRETPPTHLQH